MHNLSKAGLVMLMAVMTCTSPDSEEDPRASADTTGRTAPAGSAAADSTLHPHGESPSARAGHAGHADAPDERAVHDRHAQERAHPAHEDPRARAADHAQHDGVAHPAEHMQHDTTQAPEHAQHDTAAHAPGHEMQQHGAHAEMEANMLMGRIGKFDIMAMAQVFPVFTFSLPRNRESPLERTGLYLTQPVVTANFSSPRSEVVLRTTLNFEGMTQPEGELTWGAWGEGFLDKRHPHTLLHELMLSVNLRRATSAFSLSAGKGFPSYGTDDPMSRPVLKYPTNHHLSQALERWTVIGAALLGSWSAEASVFGGTEPTGPYDFSNIESFPDSWSARVTRRFGAGEMGTWPWELSFSHAYVVEEHENAREHTRLYNAAFRHEADHDGAHLYSLIEASRSDPEHDEPYYSVLGEAAVRIGKHLPYARVEFATRPEYEREAAATQRGFFRYDHDAEPVGATRWLIVSAGYGLTLTDSPVSPRPFVEVQYNRAWAERGGVEPATLFGRSRFWSISAGMRIFVGGEPMRMGTYGILDPMTAMHDTPTLHAMSKHRH